MSETNRSRDLDLDRLRVAAAVSHKNRARKHTTPLEVHFGIVLCGASSEGRGGKLDEAGLGFDGHPRASDRPEGAMDSKGAPLSGFQLWGADHEWEPTDSREELEVLREGEVGCLLLVRDPLCLAEVAQSRVAEAFSPGLLTHTTHHTSTGPSLPEAWASLAKLKTSSVRSYRCGIVGSVPVQQGSRRCAGLTRDLENFRATALECIEQYARTQFHLETHTMESILAEAPAYPFCTFSPPALWMRIPSPVYGCGKAPKCRVYGRPGATHPRPLPSLWAPKWRGAGRKRGRWRRMRRGHAQGVLCRSSKVPT